MAEHGFQARLARIQELQKLWSRDQERRRQDPTCTHSRGRESFAERRRNGTWQLWVGCEDCFLNVDRRWLPHDEVEWDDEGNPVSFVILRDDGYENPPCRICGAFGTELHHWAPKAIFGALEAEHWPTDYLCADCHSHWHQRMAQATSHEARDTTSQRR